MTSLYSFTDEQLLAEIKRRNKVRETPYRVFYDFEPFTVGTNRYYWSLCFFCDQKKWSNSLFKWNPKVAHWQHNKEVEYLLKDVFKLNKLKSIKCYTACVSGMGLDYDNPLVNKKFVND